MKIKQFHNNKIKIIKYFYFIIVIIFSSITNSSDGYELVKVDTIACDAAIVPSSEDKVLPEINSQQNVSNLEVVNANKIELGKHVIDLNVKLAKIFGNKSPLFVPSYTDPLYDKFIDLLLLSFNDPNFSGFFQFNSFKEPYHVMLSQKFSNQILIGKNEYIYLINFFKSMSYFSDISSSNIWISTHNFKILDNIEDFYQSVSKNTEQDNDLVDVIKDYNRKVLATSKEDNLTSYINAEILLYRKFIGLGLRQSILSFLEFYENKVLPYQAYEIADYLLYNIFIDDEFLVNPKVFFTKYKDIVPYSKGSKEFPILRSGEQNFIVYYAFEYINAIINGGAPFFDSNILKLSVLMSDLPVSDVFLMKNSEVVLDWEWLSTALKGDKYFQWKNFNFTNFEFSVKSSFKPEDLEKFYQTEAYKKYYLIDPHALVNPNNFILKLINERTNYLNIFSFEDPYLLDLLIVVRQYGGQRTLSEPSAFSDQSNQFKFSNAEVNLRNSTMSASNELVSLLIKNIERVFLENNLKLHQNYVHGLAQYIYHVIFSDPFFKINPLRFIREFEKFNSFISSDFASSYSGLSLFFLKRLKVIDVEVFNKMLDLVDDFSQDLNYTLNSSVPGISYTWRLVFDEDSTKTRKIDHYSRRVIPEVDQPEIRKTIDNAIEGLVSFLSTLQFTFKGEGMTGFRYSRGIKKVVTEFEKILLNPFFTNHPRDFIKSHLNFISDNSFDFDLEISKTKTNTLEYPDEIMVRAFINKYFLDEVAHQFNQN